MQLGLVGLGPMGSNRVRRAKGAGIGHVARSTTVRAAIDEGVPVLSRGSLLALGSPDRSEFADPALASVRRQFGGHSEQGGAGDSPEQTVARRILSVGVLA